MCTESMGRDSFLHSYFVYRQYEGTRVNFVLRILLFSELATPRCCNLKSKQKLNSVYNFEGQFHKFMTLSGKYKGTRLSGSYQRSSSFMKQEILCRLLKGNVMLKVFDSQGILHHPFLKSATSICYRDILCCHCKHPFFENLETVCSTMTMHQLSLFWCRSI
jgi:hypothetical protein